MNFEELPSPNRRRWVWYSFQLLAQLIFTICFRLRVHGIEKLPADGGALLLINHQSYLDPLVVGVALPRPVSFIARDGLFKVPVLGWILRQTYTFPINQQSPGASSIKDAVRRMRHGFLVGIFPEGSRTFDGTMGEIKPGFISLVKRGKVPVYPVAVAGANEAMPRGSWFIRMRCIRVVFGDPFTAEEIKEHTQRGKETEFAALVHKRIANCVRQAEALRHRR